MRPKATSRAAGVADTKRKILGTAERLFADHGFSVSMRKISEISAQGNNNAVQYYFKNKEGLIAAIIADRSEVIEMKRHALLLEAAAQGNLHDLETLLSISYLPPAQIVDERGRHTYARFVTQFILEQSRLEKIQYADTVKSQTAAQKITIDRLCEVLPDLPHDVVAARQRRGLYMVLGAVIAWDNDPAPVARKGPVSLVVRDAISMIVGGFAAAVRP